MISTLTHFKFHVYRSPLFGNWFAAFTAASRSKQCSRVSHFDVGYILRFLVPGEFYRSASLSAGIPTIMTVRHYIARLGMKRLNMQVQQLFPSLCFAQWMS